jgi:hypothetical protein
MGQTAVPEPRGEKEKRRMMPAESRKIYCSRLILEELQG